MRKNFSILAATATICFVALLSGRAHATSSVGASQNNPLTVTAVGNVYTFTNPTSGLWYDPPSVYYGFEYTISGGHFTSFTTPSGGTAPTGTVGLYVAGVLISTISAGQTYSFSGILTSSVTDFELGNFVTPQTISNAAYPILLAFTGLPATLTVTGLTSPISVPEPASMLLLGAGIAGIAAARRKRAAS